MKKTFVWIASLALVSMTGISWAQDNAGETGLGQQFKGRVKAHREEQKTENQAFRDSLKDKTPEERAALIKEHKEQQFNENVEFRDQIHSEKRDALEERIGKSEKLTDEQKAEILAQFDSVYKDEKGHWAEQHQENMVNFDKIYSNPNLTPEEKREKVKALIQQNKEEAKQYHEQRVAERKRKKEEFRKKRQERLTTGSDSK